MDDGSTNTAVPGRYRALITGATSGIGLAIARRLARQGVELTLVARNEQRLTEVAGTLAREGKRIADPEVISADLATEEGVDLVMARVRDADNPIDILVNNAGFGIAKPFHRSALEDEQRILDVMIEAPLSLMHAAIPGMRERGRGWILNVASMAGFLPSGTYAAAKAHVIALSRSLRVQYEGDGLNITVLCPGFVHTEFHERMGTGETAPTWMWTNADTVAREAIRGLKQGRAIVRSDWRYRLLAPLIAVLPDRAIHRIMGDRTP